MTGIKPLPEHRHTTRESRDLCQDTGICDRDTIVITWPTESHLDPIERIRMAGEINLKLLNNIEIVHIRTYNSVVGVSVEQLDDLITQLMYAKWYFTEGKYYEQTTP